MITFIHIYPSSTLQHPVLSDTQLIPSISSQVGWVREVLERQEVLLDTPRADEAVEDRDRARLVVRARTPRATEWLLANNGARALVVEIDVTRCVAQTRCGRRKDVPVLREAASGLIIKRGGYGE